MAEEINEAQNSVKYSGAWSYGLYNTAVSMCLLLNYLLC